MTLRLAVCLVYKDRPLLVRSSLISYMRALARYPNAELHVFDDNSDVGIEKTLIEYGLAHTYHRFSMKSGFGGYFCDGVSALAADVYLSLCDDDQLHPNCLKNLAKYFSASQRLSGISDIAFYDPRLNRYLGRGRYRQGEPTVGFVDGSQLSIRISAFASGLIKFTDIRNADAMMLTALESVEKPGATGFIAQIKGTHYSQLNHLDKHLVLYD